MEEGFGVAEVDFGGVCGRLAWCFFFIGEWWGVHTIVENRLNLINMRRRPRNPIYPLNLQPKQVNSLDTLIHHHRDRRPVTLEQLLQVHPKHRLQRREVTQIHRTRRWSALLLLASVLLLLLVVLLLLLMLMLRRRSLLRRHVLLQRMRLRRRRVLEG